MNPETSLQLEDFLEAVPAIFWDSGSYDRLTVEIRIKNTFPEVLLSEGWENSAGWVTLAHEFTHHFQNFTTCSGVNAALFYLEFFTIFATLSQNPNGPKIQIPIKGSDFEKQFGNHTFDNIHKYLDFGNNRRQGNNSQFDFEISREANWEFSIASQWCDLFQRDRCLGNISFNGHWIPITELVLRENMAMVASFCASQFEIQKFVAFLYDKYQPVYWVVIRFLNELFPEKDFLRLTYEICELALCTPDPIGAIHYILNFLQREHIALSDLDEEEIINKLDDSFELKKKIEEEIESIQARIASSLELIDYLARCSHLFVSLSALMEKIKMGLTFRLRNLSSYKPRLTSVDIMDFVTLIGSPCVIFEAANFEQMFLGSNGLEDQQLFMEVQSCLVVMRKIYTTEMSECPFLHEESFCDRNRGSLCYENCLSIEMDSTYHGCLMHNVIDKLAIGSK